MTSTPNPPRDPTRLGLGLAVIGRASGGGPTPRSTYTAVQTPEYAEFRGVPSPASVPVRGPLRLEGLPEEDEDEEDLEDLRADYRGSGADKDQDRDRDRGESKERGKERGKWDEHDHDLHDNDEDYDSDENENYNENEGLYRQPKSKPLPPRLPLPKTLKLSTLRTKLLSTKSKSLALIKNNTGLLLVTASQVFLSLMNVAVKKLNSIDPPVPTLELVAVRMIITYICCMTYMLSTGVPDPFFGPKGVRILLVTRGSVGFFGLFGVYYSLQYLSLSDATVLTFLAPMCTAIAGALLLGERFTKREAFAGIVSLIGVVLIARPTVIFGELSHVDIDGNGSAPPAEKGTPKERLVAVGVALVGVLGATGAYTSIRAIGKRAHPLHSMVFFSALCVFISTAGMIANKTPVIIPTRLDWLALLLMIGIFGFVAQTLLTMGLQRETAGRGSMAVYTQIVFATILERIFFHAVPTPLSVIGTLLIISSALYVAFTKEKEETSSSGGGASNGTAKSTTVSRRLGDEELELEGLLGSSSSSSSSYFPPPSSSKY